MNVLVSSNKDFLMPLEVCLYSLYKNNRNVNVFFINFSVEEKDLTSIRKTTELFKDCTFTVIDLPGVLVEKLMYSDKTSNMIKCLESHNLSIETYGKLLIPYLLPEAIERCLYLDADIIVNKDIYEFYNSDFDDNYVVGLDACGYTIRNVINHKKHFNVGVILFNLSKIRKDALLTLDRVIDYIDESMTSVKAYSDEVILNKVFDGKTLFEDSYKFNLSVPTLPCGNRNKEVREDALNNAYILHYISRDKPWKEKCTLPKESQAIWRDYYNQCFDNK